jgi:uncharacterized membrane protein YfcA
VSILAMISPLLQLVGVMGAGAVAGGLGALLGLGGGVFLVPFLNLGLGLSFREAVATSLVTVIATSSAVSARSAGKQLINLRLGMLLEVATAAGGLAGGLTMQMLSERSLQVLFASVTMAIAFVMLGRLERRNVMTEEGVDPGRLGGRFHEEESGGVVTYRVKRLPLALGVSFIAGNISSFLGIGGGILKVPALNAWCGVPLRAAAATSALMIGVTAVAAVPLYYQQGNIIEVVAAATVLGVLAGSRIGFWIGTRARAKWLKALMAFVLAAVSLSYFMRWAG